MFLMIKKVLSLVMVISLTLFLVACSNTEYTKGEYVIEASTLSELLSNDNVIVIDARSPEDYNKGHLAGAINLPPALLAVNEPVINTIAPKEQVESVLSANGISNDSHVYIYDNNGGVNAGRVWWVLRVYGHEKVSLINNGEVSISSEGLELTLEVPSVTPTTYKASDLDTSLITTLEEVKAVAEDQVEAVILDVRSQAEFDEGAIPGAILYAHTRNLYPDGSFKSARDIYLDYNDLGLERDDYIILYCKTSYRATQTAVLLAEAGFTNVSVYDGAWVEWSAQGMPQEEKKEEIVTPSVQDGS